MVFIPVTVIHKLTPLISKAMITRKSPNGVLCQYFGI